ncbi:uncharacterized protein LOC127253574 [Andrographis paniculata]|uniref:uncharacterized protein LOC127253574 n=1 Tax=Andrographis paniculata TaxID=175694 RepID=UPI0021E820CD|nr:uncharacterized protein LOC127253574 [Andrographis paniculata]
MRKGTGSRALWMGNGKKCRRAEHSKEIASGKYYNKEKAIEQVPENSECWIQQLRRCVWIDSEWRAYTIWGASNVLLEEDQQGIAPRVFYKLFDPINKEQKAFDKQLVYTCRCSFLVVLL